MSSKPTWSTSTGSRTARAVKQRNPVLNNPHKKVLCIFSVVPAYMIACYKRAPDLILDGCEPPGGGWELNSDFWKNS